MLECIQTWHKIIAHKVRITRNDLVRELIYQNDADE